MVATVVVYLHMSQCALKVFAISDVVIYVTTENRAPGVCAGRVSLGLPVVAVRSISVALVLSVCCSWYLSLAVIIFGLHSCCR